MFTYTPLSEDEANKHRYTLMPDGAYDFQVIKAEHQVSKTSGNQMIKLTLLVQDDMAKDHIIFDYLVGTDKMQWKTIQFCKAVGLLKEYQENKFNEALCEGQLGRAFIKIQKGGKKDDGKFYPDKNVIGDYMEKSVAETKQVEFVDDKLDDLPF